MEETTSRHMPAKILKLKVKERPKYKKVTDKNGAPNCQASRYLQTKHHKNSTSIKNGRRAGVFNKAWPQGRMCGTGNGNP